ncbi:MAG: hypothetical protein M0P73_05430 [Syntrophobacterales bacterium]|jgi:hypothetical protein|nr:hypothetical protein [Syntrophobacterales bacterium]
MVESNEDIPNRLIEALNTVGELPERVVETYVRLWQLEIWLRRMVYVEFRAAYGDEWETHIVTSRGRNSREADDRLTHMPTPEADLLSYSTFSDVCSTIEKESFWQYFQQYLPPKDLWTAKLIEIKLIRNRVAHFRRGHFDDLQRTLQLLRDLDKGFWGFCTSYNATRPVLPPTDDPVIHKFIHLNQFPYQQIEDNKWVMIGIADPNAWFAVTIEIISREWSKNNRIPPIAGKQGFFYDVVIVGRKQRNFDYRRYFEDTQSLHKHCVHLVPDSFSNSLRVTIPSILGKDKIIEIIDGFIFWLSNSLHSPILKLSKDEVRALADEMPEYILNPSNPLAFLEPSMQCSFFGI